MLQKDFVVEDIINIYFDLTVAIAWENLWQICMLKIGPA